MRKILLGGVALTALAAAFPSFAADLPRNSAPAPSYYSPAPVFNWTGLYLGVNGGYGFGSFTGGGTTRFGGADAGVLGATAGYNYQIGQFVVGIESDFDWTGFKSSKTYLPGPISETAKLDDLWTLRGQGRLRHGQRSALCNRRLCRRDDQDQPHRFDLPVPLGGPTYRSNKYSNGFAIGGGLEYAFTNAISVKAEYLYTSLDRQSIFGGAYLTTAAMHESLVRGGIDFHF